MYFLLITDIVVVVIIVVAASAKRIGVYSELASRRYFTSLLCITDFIDVPLLIIIIIFPISSSQLCCYLFAAVLVPRAVPKTASELCINYKIGIARLLTIWSK